MFTIHHSGMQSDPFKTRAMRAMMRLRAQCIDDGSCDPASAEVRTEQLRAADATPLTLQCGLNVPPHVKCVGLPLFLFDTFSHSECTVVLAHAVQSRQLMRCPCPT